MTHWQCPLSHLHPQKARKVSAHQKKLQSNVKKKNLTDWKIILCYTTVLELERMSVIVLDLVSNNYIINCIVSSILLPESSSYSILQLNSCMKAGHPLTAIIMYYRTHIYRVHIYMKHLNTVGWIYITLSIYICLNLSLIFVPRAVFSTVNR